MSNEENNLKGKKLIILEDDETAIFLLKALLEKTQAETQYCKTVDEFLDVYRGDKDVILLDIMVPGDKNGIDLLKYIKEREPNKPVIMQSALKEREEECRKLGADDFVDKPHIYLNLIPTIRKLIDKNKK